VHLGFVPVLFVSGRRQMAGLLALILLLWLHSFWWAALVPVPQPALLVAPQSAWVQVPGHILALLLLLAFFGVFSPRPGSPQDLALRAQRRGDFLAAGGFTCKPARPAKPYVAS
jgi:hypothetical protein